MTDIGRIRSTKWYGCRRDTRDARDVPFKPKVIRLPKAVDHRSHLPPVMNQGELGCCTGHGTTAALRFLMLKNGKADIPLSRLQNYFDAREIENSVGEDAGAEIRDNIKAAAANGIAREALWPYDIARFADRPPAAAYANAMNFQALKYKRVNVNTMCLKLALASGFPVVIGVSLYDSFESIDVEISGVVPMPNLHSEALVGGHCMLVVGYGQRAGHFTVLNSWGDDWGDKGFCYMPEKYLGSKKYGSDYWVIEAAELCD
jgi:C1A family cysteine protease